MEIESDADRLNMIKAAGGIELFLEGGSLWALFENEQGRIDIAGQGFIAGAPRLTVRTSDANRLGIKRGTVFPDIKGDAYRVGERPNDGTGMTLVELVAET